MQGGTSVSRAATRPSRMNSMSRGSGVRCIQNRATVEGLAVLRPQLEQAGLGVAVTQIQAWRGAPLAEGTRLAPLNPVLVLKGTRPAAG